MRDMVGKVFTVLEAAPQYARLADELGLMALPSSNEIQGGQYYFPKAALVLAGTPPPPHRTLHMRACTQSEGEKERCLLRGLAWPANGAQRSLMPASGNFLAELVPMQALGAFQGSPPSHNTHAHAHAHAHAPSHTTPDTPVTMKHQCTGPVGPAYTGVPQPVGRACMKACHGRAGRALRGVRGTLVFLGEFAWPTRAPPHSCRYHHTPSRDHHSSSNHDDRWYVSLTVVHRQWGLVVFLVVTRFPPIRLYRMEAVFDILITSHGGARIKLRAVSLLMRAHVHPFPTSPLTHACTAPSPCTSTKARGSRHSGQ